VRNPLGRHGVERLKYSPKDAFENFLDMRAPQKTILRSEMNHMKKSKYSLSHPAVAIWKSKIPTIDLNCLSKHVESD
jgi:hypothetical protein